MSADVNRIVISGEIYTDLKVTNFKTEDKVLWYVGFQLKSQKLKVTKPEQPSNFVWINTYDDVADYCKTYLCKGRIVRVEGSLETESYKGVGGKRLFKWFIRADKIDVLDNGNVAVNALDNSSVVMSGLETADFVTENPNA